MMNAGVARGNRGSCPLDGRGRTNSYLMTWWWWWWHYYCASASWQCDLDLSLLSLCLSVRRTLILLRLYESPNFSLIWQGHHS